MFALQVVLRIHKEFVELFKAHTIPELNFDGKLISEEKLDLLNVRYLCLWRNILEHIAVS
jgi:hypothetical protein